MEHEHARTKNLSTGGDWKREWNLGSRGAVRRGAMEEAASDPLHGESVLPLIHVWAGWSDEESEVREVPTALWNTTGRVLGCTGEWQVGNWRNGVSHNDEPDEESHGW